MLNHAYYSLIQHVYKQTNKQKKHIIVQASTNRWNTDLLTAINLYQTWTQAYVWTSL